MRSDLNFETSIEKYCPNDNLTLFINPDYPNKDYVGLINIGNLSDSVDTDLATAEATCAIYAFDESLELPSDASLVLNEILNSATGEYEYNGIKYKNYSGTGSILIVAEYEGFTR